MITQEELKARLHYNPETGIFIWIISPSRNVNIGAIAGCTDNGYIRIKIKKIKYLAHRLAWMYIHGIFPKNDIDHINNITNDNSLSNLRPATRSENRMNRGRQVNNKSGYKGVCWNKFHKKWQAQCNCHNLGYFDTAKLASIAYQEYAKQHHGEFFNSTA
jgi:hypothetical protein